MKFHRVNGNLLILLTLLVSILVTSSLSDVTHAEYNYDDEDNALTDDVKSKSSAASRYDDVESLTSYDDDLDLASYKGDVDDKLAGGLDDAAKSYDVSDDDYYYNDDVDQSHQLEPNQKEYEPQYYYQPTHKKKKRKKKVYVPVFVPENEKKKMKIISVDKGFYIQGGTQLFGKFKSLKHCMKACAITPTCLSGDYNPWLHKCYQHTNFTACNTQKSHPQFVHFSKVPCAVVDAPTGRVTLGVNMANGIEQKGIDTLQQCIKKCASAGLGIPATAVTVQSFDKQGCFAIDYDFATHRCYFFGVNYLLDENSVATLLHCIFTVDVPQPSSLGTQPNPTVVHITFCPLNTNSN